MVKPPHSKQTENDPKNDRHLCWVMFSGQKLLFTTRVFGTAYTFAGKFEWDLTNGPLSKLLELLDTQVCSGCVQWVRPLEISWMKGVSTWPMD